MTVCKFYQQGNCKFGEKCRFEHPGSERNPFGGVANYDGYDRRAASGGQSRGGGGGNPFGGQSRGGGGGNPFDGQSRGGGGGNPFGSQSKGGGGGNPFTSGFGNSGGRRNDGRSTRGGGGGGERVPTEDELRKYLDDTLSKGLWGLTGFGLDNSASVVNGDVSPEELRLQAYVSEKSGRPRIEVSREENHSIQAQRQRLEGLSSGFGAGQHSPPSFVHVDFPSLFKSAAAGSISGSAQPSNAFPVQGEAVQNPQQSAPFGASNTANVVNAQTSQIGAVFAQAAAGAVENKPAQNPFQSGGGQGFAETSGRGALAGGLNQPFGSVSNAFGESTRPAPGGFQTTQPAQPSTGQQPVAASGGREPGPQTGEQGESSARPVDIQQFQAAEFTLGKVPEVPPAPQYC
mmetsp:Transcript_45411/g.176540  ORF Transcript_45411/g.176540 Transcript_45411/m.176540 type:complete len:402 (-) Transcript_45411:1490-2695(-)|eukprot:CAMPEP_0113958054 /NCGR_PEP_ID=MMETSP0011_2-20120614/3130_1 /TAXON_ID=101924 /ORGANISM="Rhodosorus marinus" /LENGTH=401 /DNA_ID=CAMNT_0000968721 /DNA_START=200 /DNA_END=1405 /DNA_ORIENTATION=- /assembly_acc=CAM_ASM_000156